MSKERRPGPQYIVLRNEDMDTKCKQGHHTADRDTHTAILATILQEQNYLTQAFDNG